MTGWLLDTNVIAELANPLGAARVREWAAAQDERRLYLSILVLGEYAKGLSNLPEDSPLRPRVEAALVALETRFAGRVLSVSDAVVRRWGAMSGATKRATEQSPPVVDTLLAATALEHDLILVTRNVRDVRHSGAVVLNPWTGGGGASAPLRPPTRRIDRISVPPMAPRRITAPVSIFLPGFS